MIETASHHWEALKWRVGSKEAAHLCRKGRKEEIYPKDREITQRHSRRLDFQSVSNTTTVKISVRSHGESVTAACLSFPPTPRIPIRGAKSTSGLVSGQQGWNKLQKCYFSAGISIQMRKVTYLAAQRHSACAHRLHSWAFVHVCFWVSVNKLCPCSVQGMRLHR